jgi:hypothetical protein
VTPRGWRRWLGALLLVAVGLVIGVTGAFLQAERFVLSGPWGPVVVPWGVAVVWVVLLLAVRGGAWAIYSRWGAWSVTLGWLVGTVAMSAESPSGDLALSGGGRQMTYLLGGLILASVAATLPVPRRGGSRHRDISGDNAGNQPAAQRVP